MTKLLNMPVFVKNNNNSNIIKFGYIDKKLAKKPKKLKKLFKF